MSHTETELSAPEIKARDVLAALFSGIYHISREWRNRKLEGQNVSVVIMDGHSMATYDFALLTRLVVLCHDAAVRCEVTAAAHGYLRLTFSPRIRGDESLFYRHPTMEEAVTFTREEIADLRVSPLPEET